MFSFHKPRVYRSAEGCCICRAKSSSSRFTDSRKYEQDSMKCFDLKYPRHGEICNACVLLVKRFKRLPVGSTRHWGHVVDARAGPGTKSISKHKKGRDDSETTAHSASSSSTRRAPNSKSLIPEKFSKIFKKSKKSKIDVGACTERKADGCRRSAVPGLKAWSDQQSFSATPDSMDSDYEDIAESGDVYDAKRVNVNANNTIVQFQTQTRASANRASRRATITSNASSNPRKSPLKTGSKRRKCMPPIRNRSTLKLTNEKAQFFDETEWQERKTCCGMTYECSSLAGSILIDTDKFEVCSEHKRSQISQISQIETASTAKEELSSTSQKTIIATLPAVVQISAPTTTSVCPPPLPNPVNMIKPNHTPVLKKHHLFFKRQSESFPQVDLAVNNNIINSSNKTESLAVSTTTPVIIKSSTSTANHSASMPHSSTAITIGGNSNIVVSTPLPLAISTTNISAISSISPSSATATSVTAQMPRHSTAKVTTISPPLPTTNIIGGNRLLHKIKAGKIFKHSLEKIGVTSTAAPVSSATVERIKAGDFQDIKPVIRNVAKSYVVSKPMTSGSSQQSTQYYPVGSSPTSTCSNSSATSSSSSSTAPKFSDNSSDSGFDENLQDRKSASPLQEDTEKKLAARAAIGNVHTMFLASGVQIHGQHQNLMLTGNEVAAKLLQNRKQQMAMMANSSGGAMQQHFQQQQQSATNVSRIGSATSSLKISPVTPATISTISVGNSGGSNSHSKTPTATLTTTRAIYNNNTIQHENGVTTIVPASSLAASNQTAAMNALAPSTVTITPAPTHQLGNSASSAALGLTKKLTTSGVGVNLIAGGVNNQSNILHTATNAASHLLNHGNSTLLHQQAHHLQQQPQPLQHHNTASNLNQKIILLKTSDLSKYNNLANISSSSLNSVKLPNGSTPMASNANTGGGVCKN
ncbi:mucin-2 isoform X1 [Zeugodacus cucurbitae]|uniref:mucin-2 isoform X1 n=1 Tax=Zeugodacus cucurbitae TaxID=28588 RepID=UPI0023D90461|nr:mucin-2 isoform X1 [Zeugodacus cucurbitae]XP_011191120.2 mucin-2 isoform X1 [Zeugodacus cucurbitae]XP_054087530.1 mucin-2 isoform X1 [Zeugodacus cucurbitae]